MASRAGHVARASGHVFIATSLDGFIARPNGDIDWLTGHGGRGEDHGYDSFMARVDGIVMGRGTFEKVLTFGAWPYTKPVIVMSRTLGPRDLPGRLAGKARFTDHTPRGVMKDLMYQGLGRLYVDGGKIIQSFLRADLIADMIVTQIPILLGDGIRLFGKTGGDI